MKKLYLSGKHSQIFTLVDDEDYEVLSLYHWYLSERGYVKNRTLGRIHRFIMFNAGHNIEGLEIDHIYHNKLDNQKASLRVVTREENRLNQPFKLNKTELKQKRTFRKIKCQKLKDDPYRKSTEIKVNIVFTTGELHRMALIKELESIEKDHAELSKGLAILENRKQSLLDTLYPPKTKKEVREAKKREKKPMKPFSFPESIELSEDEKSLLSIEVINNYEEELKKYKEEYLVYKEYQTKVRFHNLHQNKKKELPPKVEKPVQPQKPI